MLKFERIMDSRPWFDDGPQKAILLQRIANGLYIQFSAQQDSRKHVGQVLRTIYTGYKVKTPSGEEINVNLLKDHVVELSGLEEYNAAAEPWKQEEAEIQEAARQKREADAAAAQAILDKQATCLHEEVRRESVARIAGCDIDDFVCVACEKRLQRSWWTAYESDPKSHISDWEWFLRYCNKEYNGYIPKREEYEIVSRIGTEMYR